MSNILDGVSEELEYLWNMRDKAKTLEQRKMVQEKIDEYFLPPKQKAQRKKPKKKMYIPDDGWAY